MTSVPTSDLTGADADELGPLTVGHDHGGLRQRLLREFRGAVDAARAALLASGADRVAAIHNYRRAMRTALALVKMVADALPKGERKTLVETLREARQALSIARDHDVAPAVLAAFAVDEALAPAITDLLAGAKASAQPWDEVETLLRDGVNRLAAQVDALDAALPALKQRDVLAGLGQTYRQARRARRKAKKSVAQFHRFRRRLKELAYQLEFLSQAGGARMAACKDDYVGLSTACGGVADLVMARQYVSTYGDAKAADQLAALDESLAAQIAEQAIAQRKASKDLFRRSPRKFAKRLERLVTKDERGDVPPLVGDDPGDSD